MWWKIANEFFVIVENETESWYNEVKEIYREGSK